MLFRKLQNPNGEKLQTVVPMSERRKILHYCHDHITAGHLGIRKTLSKVRNIFYWPGQQRDVKQYIAGCDTCSRRKGPYRTQKTPMQIVGTGSPMERLAIDILGDLPITDRGNRYVLVVSDYFTKWTEAFPMPDMTAQTVAELIVREVVSRFGVPSSIHSDQGRQFEGHLLLHIKYYISRKRAQHLTTLSQMAW